MLLERDGDWQGCRATRRSLCAAGSCRGGTKGSPCRSQRVSSGGQSVSVSRGCAGLALRDLRRALSGELVRPTHVLTEVCSHSPLPALGPPRPAELWAQDSPSRHQRSLSHNLTMTTARGGRSDHRRLLLVLDRDSGCRRDWSCLEMPTDQVTGVDEAL